jgi:glycogen(starch) synthase
MRVALVVRALPVHRPGGLEYHTYDLANALQRRGCSVVVVTSRHPEGKERETWASGVEVVYLRKGPPGDYSRSFFRGVEEAVEQLDHQRRFDVIHAQEFAGLWMKRRPGRFVATIHGTMTTETPLDRRYFAHLTWRERFAALWYGKARIALIPVFHAFLSRVDHILVDSHFTRRELLRIKPSTGERTTVVPLGIDFSRYDLPCSPPDKDECGPLKIVMLGRVQFMRGFLEALGAAYRLRWYGMAFHMRIAGTASPPEWIEDAMGQFLLEDVVTYEGRIDQEEVSELLRWGDVFLFADRTQPAFGLACVEALAHGTPVLATRVGAVPEVVRDDVGWLCEPWDTQDMTAQLIRIASARAELRQKAARAWSYAREFHADAMAQNTLRVYETLR